MNVPAIEHADPEEVAAEAASHTGPVEGGAGVEVRGGFTDREMRGMWEKSAEIYCKAYVDERKRCIEVTAERDALVRELAELKAERDTGNIALRREAVKVVGDAVALTRAALERYR